MAKKAVASLQKGTKKMTKAIKMVKSSKTGSYTFEEKIINADRIKDYFSRN